MLHADEGMLHGYLDGALPPAERAWLDAHLRDCAECRESLDSARALVARTSALLGVVAPPEREIPAYDRLRAPRRHRWRLPVAWAASIAAAFATGWYLQGQRDAGQPASNATELAQRPSAPQSAAPAAGTPLASSTPRPAARPPAAPARPSVAESSAGVAAAPVALALDAKAKAAPAAGAAVADAAPERRDAGRGSPLDTAMAVAVLGQTPAALPDARILSMTPIPSEEGGGVVIEQEVGRGTVIRLYQRQVPVNRAEAPVTRDRAGARSSAQPAPAAREQASERLARYVGTLRVEIEGPLPADSLSKLLDLVR